MLTMKPDAVLGRDRPSCRATPTKRAAVAIVCSRGLERGHDLDQRHHRDRREEVQAEHALRARTTLASARDRDARGVRRQHRVRGRDRDRARGSTASLISTSSLTASITSSRSRERAEVLDPVDPREQRAALRLVELARPRRRARWRPRCAASAAGASGLDRLEHRDVVPGASDGLGDPGAHQAAADDADAQRVRRAMGRESG